MLFSVDKMEDTKRQKQSKGKEYFMNNELKSHKIFINITYKDLRNVKWFLKHYKIENMVNFTSDP